MTVTENIISTSEKLFMKYGLKSISMDDIAKALGISKKTIYKNIGNKETLVSKVISIFLKREAKVVSRIRINSQDAVEELIGVANHLLKISSKLKPTFIFDIRKYYPKAWKEVEKYHFQYIRDTVTNNLKRGMKEGLYRQNINPEVVAMLYVGRTLTMKEEELFPLSKVTAKDVMQQQILYHLYGILSEEGLKKLGQHEIEVL